MRTLAEALNQRVLLTDGSLARQLRARELDLARDLFGAADALEALNLTRARLVRELHVAYLRAGADVVRTNSLGASPLTLSRFGLGEQAFYINYAAAEIACQAVDSVPGRGRRRFVLGVIRDDGWDLAPKEIENAVAVQAEGLIAGGVDGLALDLVPGRGRAGIFLKGAERARAELRGRAPIFLQCGHDRVDFSESARKAADGLIRFVPGRQERSDWLARALAAERVNLVGGGASPKETAALDRLLRRQAEDGLRPLTAWIKAGAVDEVVPPSSSLEIDPAVAEVA